MQYAFRVEVFNQILRCLNVKTLFFKQLINKISEMSFFLKDLRPCMVGVICLELVGFGTGNFFPLLFGSNYWLWLKYVIPWKPHVLRNLQIFPLTQVFVKFSLQKKNSVTIYLLLILPSDDFMWELRQLPFIFRFDFANLLPVVCLQFQIFRFGLGSSMDCGIQSLNSVAVI